MHNYGITYHRNLRSKGTFINELDQIKGIGKSTSGLLLRDFKSVKNIRTKSEEELTKIIGKAKTELLLKFFNK